MYVYYTARACLQFTCITKLLFDSDSAESLPNSRKGRGKKMVSTIRSLMRDSNKWFEITNESDCQANSEQTHDLLQFRSIGQAVFEDFVQSNLISQDLMPQSNKNTFHSPHIFNLSDSNGM